ncbi:MAG: PorP/SprF family type IX secretion system membrane protein [Flavobacteriales bacterium]|nr:PorP/SprF family type IX secretion system membrane protein [Flavobacteriales bacterium]
MRKLLWTIALVSMGMISQAQDIHFSQFFAAPTFTNPALTGHFEGTYRLHGITRNQWWSVSAQPFQTFGGAFDVNSPFNLKNTGAGLRFSHDFAGLSSLSTTQVYGMLSKRFPIIGDRNLSLHVGAQGGFWMQSIDFSKLTFDDQFNGIRFDPNLATQQSFGNGSTNVFNFGAGAYLEQRFSERNRWGIGFSSMNLTQPDRSFFKSTEARLARRNDVHVLTSFPIGGVWDIMPAARYQWQGPHAELQGGTAIRYHLSTGPMNPRSLQMGFWYRLNDAAYTSIGIQLNNLYVGGAYDINISRLQPATNYRGGWEATVIYIIPTVREKVKRLRQCPDYL